MRAKEPVPHSDTASAGPAGYAEQVRVRGLVQGVGLRPAIWRLAQQFRLRGWVRNDGAGVTALLCGPQADIGALLDALHRAPPPLARIDAIERAPVAIPAHCVDFRILASSADAVHTGVVPDAATCPACAQEMRDPTGRRYRYAFVNCTHCGPRLSIIEAIPYDRAATTMRSFRMCRACAAEYNDPGDRRFHAQPIACPTCGPHVWLEPAADGDAVDTARTLLLAGRIVAIKALGGFHLACDATNPVTVARLRAAKRREAKPFALMARDLPTIHRYAEVTDADAAVLQSPAAPIVLLQPRMPEPLAGVAPGLASLGFMLPATPLHHLLLCDIDRPLVMTSGNLSDEPQCIDNDEARTRLGGIADHFLMHNRAIARRIDDSVVRTMAGAARILRRARGYAPVPLPLPPGFAAAPALLAMGAELKASFALLHDGQAVLSHHMGDLENAASFADYTRSITDYRTLFAHTPRAVAVDGHPDYLSAKHGCELAAREHLPIIAVQHHHAHLAACLAENNVPLDTGPVVGIVLDGLGWGEDGTIWGGEFLRGTYRDFQRLACFKPVAMPGGTQAIREPWRNTYAHIAASLGWPRFTAHYANTDLHAALARKPISVLDGMIARGVNAPLSSSCGRLFDAVAGAVGLCSDHALYEGQAAMLLEAIAAPHASEDDGAGYPFAITETAAGLLHLDPAPLWPALLEDLAGAPVPQIASRFHVGLSIGIVRMIAELRVTGQVALSGGAFQNRLLLEQVTRRLEQLGLEVLTQRMIPVNDGGLALGQGAVAAAHLLAGDADGD